MLPFNFQLDGNLLVFKYLRHHPTIDCNSFNPLVDPCTGILTYQQPTASDNCNGPITFVFSGPTSGTVLPLGSSTVMYQVVDSSNNQSSCSFTVTNDNQLSVEVSITDALCKDEASGSAIANPSGTNPTFTYLWSTGETTQDIYNLSAGVYLVTVTDNQQCTVISEVQISEPNELVITDIIVVDASAPGQSDGSISLTVNGGTGTSTYFFNPDISMGFPAGSYFIDVTDSNGCMITSEEITVGTLVSNEDVLLEKNIQLYPNPSSGQVYLDFTLPSSMNVVINLYDVNGKVLLERPMESIAQKDIQLDMSTFSNGLYFVQIQVDENVLMKRFILQKK